DGYYPGAAAVTEESTRLQNERTALLEAATLPEEKEALAKLDRDLAGVLRELASLPPQSVVYAGGIHFGSRAFRGTGPDGGRPRPIRILTRGSVLQPGKEVGPGALHALTALPARFDVPPDAPEGQRRAALARWLTDARNPLTWRSIVNRIWHYHFGRGIVETPNDFGRNGARPMHPAPLAWRPR